MLDKRNREMQDYLHRENVSRYNTQLQAAHAVNDENRCALLRKIIVDENASYRAVKDQHKVEDK